jgi:hypothetical protein
VQVVVTMPWTTWVGLGEDPARIEGYGPVDADWVRALVASMGASMGTASTWRCAVTDDVHGSLLGLGRPTRTNGYVPSPRAGEFARVAAGTCVVPGCGRRAAACDLDHTTPYPEGATCVCNLQPLCRWHHRLKTTGRFSVRTDTRAHDLPATPPADGRRLSEVEPGPREGPAPGTVQVTTRAGLTYTAPPARLAPLTDNPPPPGPPPRTTGDPPGDPADDPADDPAPF